MQPINVMHRKEREDYNMELSTKFNVGQKVFVIKSQSTHKKVICPMCDGEGYVIVYSPLSNEESKRREFPCPGCHGMKLITGELIDRYIIEETVITGIKISIKGRTNNGAWMRGIYFAYRVKDDASSKGESSYPEYTNMIFATEQEANIVCQELNQNQETIWHGLEEHPETYKPIVVREKGGEISDRYFWNGHCYYEKIENENNDGTFDDFPAELIEDGFTQWRYA